MNKDFFYGRKVLVTGSSSGIGKETARLFAKNGYSVFGVSRRIEEGREDYGEGSVTYLKMDVTEKESIQRVLDTIGDFSILIHSAGFGIAGSAEDSDISLVRLQEETDYYGVLLLNSLALPILRRQDKSLVIAVSSIAARVPLPFQGHYSAAKYALEAYMGALRNEIKEFGVRVCVVEPGDLSTGFTSKRKNPPYRKAVGFTYKILMFLLRFFPDRLTLYILRKMYNLD